jgi:hypothetical protein
MSIKNVGKYHQNKIRRQALKDPVGSYFFGGFDLLPKDKQEEVLNYFKTLNDKQEKVERKIIWKETT